MNTKCDNSLNRSETIHGFEILLGIEITSYNGAGFKRSTVE